jgi:hypothetical protein
LIPEVHPYLNKERVSATMVKIACLGLLALLVAAHLACWWSGLSPAGKRRFKRDLFRRRKHWPELRGKELRQFLDQGILPATPASRRRPRMHFWARLPFRLLAWLTPAHPPTSN